MGWSCPTPAGKSAVGVDTIRRIPRGSPQGHPRRRHGGNRSHAHRRSPSHTGGELPPRPTRSATSARSSVTHDGEVQAWAQACEIKATRNTSPASSASGGPSTAGDHRRVPDRDRRRSRRTQQPGRSEDDEDDEETRTTDRPPPRGPELATGYARHRPAPVAGRSRALHRPVGRGDEGRTRTRRKGARDRREIRGAAWPRIGPRQARPGTAEAISKSEASDARWLERARSKKRRLTSTTPSSLS